MNIATGTQLGRYEIRDLIGAGGMGQVYRAHDSSLGRDVAIKILPAEMSLNQDRLQRFEQEARATSVLNHPNILAIFDIGSFEGAPYVVSELLHGETLRDRLIPGALPVRKAIEYAIQIARGLAAAHEKGIVHRDMKPENVFLTTDGHAKILDFGLAKLLDPSVPDEGSSQADTRRVSTQPGTVLGSAGYMSPEQVRGQATDQRSDIFSFGAVLYEMVTGERAFRGESSVETMNAILKEEPPPLQVSERGIAPALELAITHCLEKKPQDRFQSARDLAFGLESITTQSGVYRATAHQPEAAKRRLWPRLAALALAASLALVFYLGRKSVIPSLPTYTQLTFRPGSIYSARFTPDGKGIFFSATWNGNPIDIFSMRAESPNVQSLGMPNAEVLSISPTGEMAVLLNSKYLFHFVNQGTLARMPLTGGVAREMLENAQEADWGTDDKTLAVVRFDSVHTQLEYPIGKKIYQTLGYISNPRVSPKGDRIAFLDHPIHGDNRGSVMVIDSSGQNQKKLTEEWAGQDGLAWSPAGDEIWFTATKAGEAQALYAVALSGKQRTVLTTPVGVKLQDISRDGEVLLTGSHESTPMIGLMPNQNKERDLSWLNRVRMADLSQDGTSFIFTESGQGSGANYSIYLRKTDGSPAVRLGEGYGLARSPDGKWVLSMLFSPPQIVLLPTGAGEAKRLERFGVEQYNPLGASWLPDGNSIVFIGKEKDHALRTYVQDLAGGAPRPVTPEGVTGFLLSPDGKLLVAQDRKGKKSLFPLAGGEARPLSGLEDDYRVIRWGSEPDILYVYQSREVPMKIYKFNIASGQKDLWKEITLADPAGRLGAVNVLLTPDGKGYVYAFSRQLNDLYLVKGLR